MKEIWGKLTGWADTAKLRQAFAARKYAKDAQATIINREIGGSP